MRVLVATKETQGQRKNDFSWTTEGELLTIGFRCDGEKVDDACGCARSWVGIESHNATTTGKVVESSMTAQEFEERLRKSLVESWGKDAGELAHDDAVEMLRIAAAFPVGSVLENRGSRVQRRRMR